MHVDKERQYMKEKKWWVAQKGPKGIFRINICSEVAGKRSLRIPHPSFGPKANTMRSCDERSLDSNAGSPILEVSLPLPRFVPKAQKKANPSPKNRPLPSPAGPAEEGQTRRRGAGSGPNSFESNTLDALGDRVEVDILGVEGDDVAVRVAHSGCARIDRVLHVLLALDELCSVPC